MKRLNLIMLMLLALVAQPIFSQSISLKFNRTGTNAQSVAISVVDDAGNTIPGVTATLTSSIDFMGTTNNVTTSVICPNVNGKSGPTIELELTVNGIPAGFSFNKVGLDIHALNSGGGYQDKNDGVVRQWNVLATVNGTTFGSLNDIDIAAGVDTSGATHKMWEIINPQAVECGETVTAKLTITKGTTNNGCFFGLSEILLTKIEMEPEPEPSVTEGKIYYISWKNTGANYITEEADNRMTVQSQNLTKAQFWKFIPTGNDNCFYIQNTVTGRYMGSCNLTPSSESKIYTTGTPQEYYVGKTAATSGENANCVYLSSTDCDNYDNEGSNPRALNKDGASDYIITWKAGIENNKYNAGSYWTLIEYSPFDGSEAIGEIGASYNIEAKNGKNLTIKDGVPVLTDPDGFDENQEWYFVRTGNAEGWQIASASEPATVIGVADGVLVAGEGYATQWTVSESEVNGYFCFTSENTPFEVDGETLFRFIRLRSAYARSLKIYKNPCGTPGDNYVKTARIHGKGAVGNIIYEKNSKPGTWHEMYAMDKGEVVKSEKFNIDVTLAENAASDLTVIAHFDWNSDGVFETAVPLDLNGTKANAEVLVPEWAAETQTRMRLRVNSNGLDLADDDVHGFIYDFHIKVVTAQEERTASVAVNSWERGKVSLSQVAEKYAYGTELTAKAIAYGNAQFVCWREEGVVVSTDAEYTFTVDRNVNLVAYFSPNTDEDSYPTAIADVEMCDDIVVLVHDGSITAQGSAEVVAMRLYTVNAATVAQVMGNTMDTVGIKEGVYIVCVITSNGYRNYKIYLNK